ncbi:MAG TPA: site-2 protease family protein [Mycobacteriales bacterium]|nr:site-2 protease family protein [Mycobacteriales bacterium]
MLYALSHPASLALLLVSYVVGLTLHGVVQAAVARWRGDRRPAHEGRLKADPRVHIDPFGAVGALISGLGWVRPVELQRRSKAVIVWVSLAGPAVQLVLGVALLLLWRVLDGPGDPFPGGAAYFLQHGRPLSDGADLLRLAGASQLYLGVLSLVPLPPLDGGRLLFALAPRTQGWLRAEHQLAERNIGVAVLLALLLVPLGGPVPILPDLLDALLGPLMGLLCGA